MTLPTLSAGMLKHGCPHVHSRLAAGDTALVCTTCGLRMELPDDVLRVLPGCSPVPAAPTPGVAR